MRTLSTDATLTDLALSGVTLDQAFAPATEDYTATVVNSVMETTVTATTAHSGATVAFKDGDDNPLTNPVTLADGTNVIKAVVTAEDTTTMKTYMVTVTRAGTPVTIEAQHESIGAGLEDLVFTLTRTGETTDELPVTVIITQAELWLGTSDLSHNVTFPAGDDTEELTIGANRFSFTPSTTGDLTASVMGDGISGGEDTVQIISTSGPPITASYEETAYTFAENATDPAIYALATLDAAYPRGPSFVFDVSFSSRSGTAESPEDYAAISWSGSFSQNDFTRDVDTDPLVARHAVPGFAIVNDDIYEGSESFKMWIEGSPALSADLVQFANPDGTTCIGFTCVAEYPVTITDEGDLPMLTLSVDPPSIAEEDDDGTPGIAENVSTVTVEITNGKTFAEDQTVTLTFSGGTQGTHYSVNPADADTSAAGHQVVLPTGDSSVEVTVTAVGNDTADGNLTLTVTGDLDGTAFDTRDITILDDETTTTNNDATGAPAITGTPQVGQTLTAGMGDIDDDDGLPSTTFPDGYSFQWVKVATGGAETNVGANSITYSPLAADEGSTIRVDVSFTDGAGNAETVSSVPVGPVVAAAEDCVVDRPNNDWCATMTVEVVGGPFATAGYDAGNNGALDNATIDYGSKSFTVAKLSTSTAPPEFDIDAVIITFQNAVEFLPLGTVFNFGGTEFTADIDSELSTVGEYEWDLPANFGWIDGQKVTVSANLAPAPESGTVDGTTLVLTHAEDLDTSSTPAAGSYTVKLDGGTGPVVSGVAVGVRTVTLTLATAVTAADINVTVDYDAPMSSPLQDVSGLDAPDSEDFPVTNNTGATTNVCTAPDLSGRKQIWTGTVTVEAIEVSGGVVVGHGFSDSDSSGALDDTTFGVGSNNYVIDAAFKRAVGVGGSLRFSLTSDLSTTDLAQLTLHVCDDSFAFSAATPDTLSTYDWSTSTDDWSSETTRTLYLSVLDVTIEAEHDSIGAGLEDLNFTLTRTGDTTEPLDAPVIITQDEPWLGNSDLSHTVPFGAGNATAELTIAATKFSFTPSTTDDLTATVSGGSDTVQIVSTSEPPIAVGYDKSAYTFEEDDPDPAAVYAVATLDAAYPRAPSRVFGAEASFSVSTESGTARFRDDFDPVTTTVFFNADDFQLVDGQYVARKPISDFAILDDVIYEGSEQFLLKLEAGAAANLNVFRIQKPDGTAGGIYDVIITDEEDLPVLSLSVDPPSIAEEDDDGTTGVTENVSTVTVAITNAKTFAVDRTVTLTFSGDATEGTHYSVSPTDADSNVAGHQVLLPAETASVVVTVTAAGNDTADGNVTLTVTGDLDGTAIGMRDITILDDDTTTTNNDATGAPGITGTPQVGDELTATLGSIADTDVLPATFPDDYDFQWVRLDGTNNPTNVGTNSNTYTVLPADVDSTIRVDVSFTDGAGNLEGPLMSTAVGPVVALLPVLSFAETTVNVDETAGTVELTVNLAPASTGQVTVDYATSNGTSDLTGAEAGEDYTAQSDTLIFTAGETSKTITIQITDDDIHEDVEFFFVDLANPSGATESATAGRTEVHITSEESEPTASMDDVTVVEGAGTMRLTLRLSHPSSRHIQYSTSTADVGGTATVSEDYADFLGVDRLITVRLGELTKDFDITIIDDGAAESDETITIEWTKNSADQVTPDVLNFTGTITDNDGTINTCLAPNLAGRTQIWTGAVTVGARGTTEYGFSSVSGLRFGALDDTTFRVGTNDYTVDSATVLSSINPGQLRFSLTSEPTSTDIEGLTLHVCDAAFAFADAGSGIGGHTYNWASSLSDLGAEIIFADCHLSLSSV